VIKIIMHSKSSICPDTRKIAKHSSIHKTSYLILLSYLFLFLPSVGNAQCTAPINIPVSDMILWLCPDSGVYNSSNNPASIGEEVYEWHDISGNNWVFENTRHSRRPMLDTNNGNTYLDFNGGDYLSNSAIVDSINGLGEFSIFVVIKSNATNTDNGFLFHRYPPNGSDDGLCLRYDAAGANSGRSNLIKSGLLGNTGGNQIETNNNTQTTNRQTLTIRWASGGRLYSFINGTPDDSSNNNVTGPLSGLSEIVIGKGAKNNNVNSGWDGYIGSIIFYKNQYPDDTIRDISIALPIELLNFDAQINADQVEIKWTTASETNNDYFTIEKTKDGNSYETVAIVDGAGNSIERRDYSSLDNNPYKGLSYYRLKQTDYDGSFEYSKHIAINYRLKNHLNIYPNPLINRTFYLKLDGISEKKLEIRLINSMGSTVFSTSIQLEEETNPIRITLPEHIARGIYYLIGSNNDEVIQQKLVIE